VNERDWSPSPYSSNEAPRASASTTRERHVGTLTRSIHGEVAQDNGIEAEAPRIRVRKLFAPKLRDAVRRDRRRLGILRRRVALGVAVHRRRRCEDDPDSGARGALEHALRREQVAPHVVVEHRAEAAHAGLAGEVEHTVEAVERKVVLG
jgi:hypothetical protein